MHALNRQTLAKQSILTEPLPERVLQFGEGNFLRAFVEDFLETMNLEHGLRAGVVVVQPIPTGLVDKLNEQQGLYTLLKRGVVGGKATSASRIITCVQRAINPYEQFEDFLACARNPDLRYIVSNTTEAGIVCSDEDKYGDRPPVSFPAKLTRLMHERFLAMGGADAPGFVMLSCELIDNNGDELRACVLRTAQRWDLGAEFEAWLLSGKNLFCNTLVDRIVTGYPRGEADAINAENGFVDQLLDTAEPFGFWAIQAPDWLSDELPMDKVGLPVRFSEDITLYKKRKVRILNGAHTMMVLAAFRAGLDTVGQCLSDPLVSSFLARGLDAEILPAHSDLPDAASFAASVLERFANPHIQHQLLSIALNSVSKWKARVLPSVKAYLKQFGKLPKCLTFSLSALIHFYLGAMDAEGKYVGDRDGKPYPIQDDAAIQRFFASLAEQSAEGTAKSVCRNTSLWGEDLSQIPGMEAAVAAGLADIQQNGIRAAIARCMEG